MIAKCLLLLLLLCPFPPARPSVRLSVHPPRERGAAEADVAFAGGIGRGHVVVANYSSALEVLLLSYWLSTPRFAFPVARRGDNGREEVDVVVLGFLGALRQACGSQVRCICLRSHLSVLLLLLLLLPPNPPRTTASPVSRPPTVAAVVVVDVS
jgi:hypothetical protein